MMRKKLTVLSGIFVMMLCAGCGEQESTAQELEIIDITDQEDAPDEAVESDGDVADSEEAEGQADQEKAGEASSQTEEGLEVPENGRRLTSDELWEYTEWIQERSNYGFLLSEWDSPTQIDWYEVFYNGAGISREGTEAEKQAYLDRNGLTEIETDFCAMDKAAVSRMMLEKVGLSYDEIVAKGSGGLENWYDAEADSFCTMAGDTNYISFICTDGVINEEETRVILQCDGDDWVRTCQVKVAEGEGERGFLSNHILSGLILEREE